MVLQQLEKRFRFADHKVNQFRSLAFPFTSDGLNPGVIRALGCLLPGQQQHKQQQQLAGQQTPPALLGYPHSVSSVSSGILFGQRFDNLLATRASLKSCRAVAGEAVGKAFCSLIDAWEMQRGAAQSTERSLKRVPEPATGTSPVPG